MRRERLKHLMANAILELWKKETGSLSPVIIEGTICITSGSGKTTVVQVKWFCISEAYIIQVFLLNLKKNRNVSYMSFNPHCHMFNMISECYGFFLISWKILTV